MKRFVRIQSNKTIVVSAGLQNINVSNKDAHVENRLKVNSMWQNTSVKIMNGSGYYPACVKNWNSTKKLVELGILTIGEETDTINDKDMLAVAEGLEKKLMQADAKYKAQLDNSLMDPLSNDKDKARNKAKKNLGLLKPEPIELVREGLEPTDAKLIKGE